MNLLSSVYNSLTKQVVALRESFNPTPEGTLSKFSPELIGVILSSMDQKSLESATQVNKEWKNMGLNKDFYFKFIQENPESIKSFKFGFKQDFELVKAYNRQKAEEIFKPYPQEIGIIIAKQ